ncbi:hypothetical protein AAVH_34164 [Aphelenchoides avenae]|nr:hypothetical protein AAVH_34164 [Aphelenchus avenae]
MTTFVKATILVSLVVLCALAAAQRPPKSRGDHTARAQRQAVPLVDATDNTHHDVGVHDDGQGSPSAAEEPAADRLKRQVAPTRLDDINIKVDAVDNFQHGAGGQEAGEEEQRFKRQNPGGPGP